MQIMRKKKKLCGLLPSELLGRGLGDGRLPSGVPGTDPAHRLLDGHGGQGDGSSGAKDVHGAELGRALGGLIVHFRSFRL